jgi:hypothetical protein
VSATPAGRRAIQRDRNPIATARELAATLVTRDRGIIAYGEW